MTTTWISAYGIQVPVSSYPGITGHVPVIPSTQAGLTRERISAAWYSGRLRLPPWIDDWSKSTPEIKAALREMLTSPVVKPALFSKVFAVASLDLQIHPADETAEDRQVADFHSYAFERAEGGPMQIAQSIVTGGLVDGFSVVHAPMQVLERGKWRGKWAFRAFRDKDTEELYLVTDRYRNVTGVEAREVGPRGETRTVIYPANQPDSNLFVTPYLPLWSNPAGLSDLRAAYWPWYRMKLAEGFRQVHLEKFTSPMLKGIYQGDPETDPRARKQKDTLEEAMADAKSRTWISVPEGTLVEAMQLASRGEGEFAAAIKDYTDQIVLSITGATLQMLVANADSDLRGDSRTQNSTAELFVWYLSRLVTNVYNTYLIPLQTDLNFPGADYPTATLGSVNDADLTASLQIDQGLAQLGFKHSAAALAKYYGRQQATDPADQLGGGGAPSEPPTPFAEQEGVAKPLPYTLALGPLWRVRQGVRGRDFSPGQVRGVVQGGDLPFVALGKSLRVPERSLTEYVARCQAAAESLPR